MRHAYRSGGKDTMGNYSRDDELNSTLPFLGLVPHRMTTSGAHIFVLLTIGEDQQQSLAHGSRHLTTGAKECGGLEVLKIRLTRHRLNHNAEQSVRQGIEMPYNYTIPQLILYVLP